MSGERILAIDTATEGCSAALLIGEEIVEQFEVTPRGHTQRILPMVDQLLAEAECTLQQLDAIAFDRGPGSFTGLRITAGVVQGLAYGAERPVIPVSSLAALASAHFQQHGVANILSGIDARMGELSWGAFCIDEQGIPQLQGAECVAAVDSLPLPPSVAGTWNGVGSGWGSDGEALQTRFGASVRQTDADALPHAREVARLAVHDLLQGKVLAAEEAQPIYLRNNVVHQKR